MNNIPKQLTSKFYAQNTENVQPQTPTQLNKLESYFRKLINRSPQNAYGFRKLAEILITQNKVEEASYYLTTAEQLDPSRQPLIETLKLQLISKQTNLETSQNPSEVLPESPQIETAEQVANLIYLANVHKLNKDYEQAESSLRQALKLEPSNVHTLTRLGLILIETKKLDEAIQFLTQIDLTASTSTIALLGLGEVYNLKKDYTTAKDYLRQSLKIDQNNVLTLTSLGRILIATEELDEAILFLTQAEKAEPNNPMVLSSFADIYRIKKDYSTAKDYLIQSLQIDPNNEYTLDILGTTLIATNELDEASKVFCSLGNIYRKNRENEQAKNYLRQSLKITPDNVLALRFFGTVLYESGELDEAIEVLEKANELAPKDAETLTCLGDIYRRQEDYVSSENYLRQSLEINPRSNSTLLILGTVLIVIDEIDEAIEVLEEAESINPTNPLILNQLVSAHNFDENEGKAEHYVRKSLQIEPESIWALKALGLILMSKGDEDEALKIFIQAQKLSPNDREILSRLGEIYRFKKEYVKAEHFLRLSLDLFPNEVEASNSLALTLLKVNKVDEAIELLTKANTQEPNDERILSSLGEAYRLKKDYIQAEVFLRKSLKISPDDVPTLAILGTVLLAQKKLDEAIECLQKANDANDTDNTVMVLNGLGTAYKKKKSYTKAIHYLRQAFKIDPTHVDTLKTLAIILMKKSELNEAIKLMEQLEKIAPNTKALSRVKSALGITYMHVLDYTKAEHYLRESLKIIPNDKVTLLYLAETLIEVDEIDEAILLLNQINELFPNETYVLSYLGCAYKNKYNYAKAEHYLNRSLEINPNNGHAITNFGQVLIATNKPDEAIKLFLPQLEKKSLKYEITLTGLGNAYRAKEEYDTAKHYLRKCLLINPNNIDALATLGIVLIRTGEINEAIQLLTQAEKQSPEDPVILDNLVHSYTIKGDHEAAKSYLKKSLQVNPDGATNFLNLQQMLTEKNTLVEQSCGLSLSFNKTGAEIFPSFTQKEKLLRDALKLNSSNVEVLIELGTLLMDQKQYPQAKNLFEEAIKTAPHSSTTYGHLGELCRRMDALDEAERHLLTATNLDSSNSVAHMSLAIVYMAQGNLELTEKYLRNSVEANPKNLQAINLLKTVVHHRLQTKNS